MDIWLCTEIHRISWTLYKTEKSRNVWEKIMWDHAMKVIHRISHTLNYDISGWYIHEYPWISMRDSISTMLISRLIGSSEPRPSCSHLEDPKPRMRPTFLSTSQLRKSRKNMRICFGLTWRLQQNGDHSKPDFDFAWFLSSEWSCSEIRDSANDKVWRFLASHDKNFLWSQHFWDIHHSEKNDPWYHVIPINQLV